MCFDIPFKQCFKFYLTKTFLNEKSARFYHVYSAESFWNFYSRSVGNKREMLFNEMIREFKPCRLYFDLEFMKQPNPDVDGIKLVASFIDFVCEIIHKKFQLKCTSKIVLELDSSTSEKFSRHLIFHMPDNKIFANNYAAGRFVKNCFAKMN
jgi:DNA-directed primase/polymerase protein